MAAVQDPSENAFSFVLDSFILPTCRKVVSPSGFHHLLSTLEGLPVDNGFMMILNVVAFTVDGRSDPLVVALLRLRDLYITYINRILDQVPDLLGLPYT